MAVFSVAATVRRTAWLAVPASLLVLSGIANAQLGDMLKSSPLGGGSTGSTQGAAGALSGLGLSPSSLTSGTAGNAAGVIEFCMKNNYLNADAATSAVKDKLLGSVSGGTQDSGYTDGSRGILSTSGGNKLDLSGSSLKAEVTRQVCDKILAQGKSML
ncbi:DUF2501 domain-containing protein [Cupriavidus oxalaticus]|uniref:DUF2501 domain-containing protein n=1 Tax=Cupriavidus oxalaticus TaxID=96344 RepID=A0A375FPG9_9BURK|nr:DUF2501 domain-containing protein [Cupriavidus oxalaticus]QEZ44782.1 DUF2501 domain-containing protein [Cupriavidus oxalaticus]QRQ83846.1 DUF2501 domain-containing protein [Cupriavidus oxalaticus]QRQ92065.1 DUF2501 domain-containing protein [Cupriavidus oxalaticus]WQD86663.1 DUF2501 domain-containing protein [Cupriavidus oxalaticus]SPC10153.1 conserved exported hypothetical protein [Cupriavidus oxalaticus]